MHVGIMPRAVARPCKRSMYTHNTKSAHKSIPLTVAGASKRGDERSIGVRSRPDCWGSARDSLETTFRAHSLGDALSLPCHANSTPARRIAPQILIVRSVALGAA